MNWYFEVLKKYAVFNGRARRKECWMFVLCNIFIVFILSFFGEILHAVFITTLYQVAVLIPSVAAGIRRMHDTDHSGWWLLFPIVNLVLAVREGQPGSNRFGPDPKAVPHHQKQDRSQCADKEFPSAKKHISKTNTLFSIPVIPPEYTSLALVESSQLGKAGPGGDSFQEAIRHMNNRDDAAAIRSFQEALAKGLDPLRQGYAHTNLGEMHFRANDLEKALDDFLRVLNCQEALFESAHTTVLYLSIVYRELGKPEEVNILEQLKHKTSGKINTSLSPETAARVRQLVINNKSRLLEIKGTSSAPAKENKKPSNTPGHSTEKTEKTTLACKRCGKTILTKKQFISELSAKHGIEVDPFNIDRFKVSGATGNFGAYTSSVISVRTKYEAVQMKRAFQCRNCDAPYCMECLIHYAPSHSNGGKSCLSCRGTFMEL
jgi:uncharacterized membrane protein YhaH (DUF805 family)